MIASLVISFLFTQKKNYNLFLIAELWVQYTSKSYFWTAQRRADTEYKY
jgi:hypothetical protein